MSLGDLCCMGTVYEIVYEIRSAKQKYILYNVIVLFNVTWSVRNDNGIDAESIKLMSFRCRFNRSFELTEKCFRVHWICVCLSWNNSYIKVIVILFEIIILFNITLVLNSSNEISSRCCLLKLPRSFLDVKSFTSSREANFFSRSRWNARDERRKIYTRARNIFLKSRLRRRNKEMLWNVCVDPPPPLRYQVSWI